LNQKPTTFNRENLTKNPNLQINLDSDKKNLKIEPNSTKNAHANKIVLNNFNNKNNIFNNIKPMNKEEIISLNNGINLNKINKLFYEKEDRAKNTIIDTNKNYHIFNNNIIKNNNILNSGNKHLNKYESGNVFNYTTNNNDKLKILKINSEIFNQYDYGIFYIKFFIFKLISS